MTLLVSAGLLLLGAVAALRLPRVDGVRPPRSARSAAGGAAQGDRESARAAAGRAAAPAELADAGPAGAASRAVAGGAAPAVTLARAAR